MKKVFIATTTFGEEDPSVLGALKKAGIHYDLNPQRRRLQEKEILNILAQGGYQGLLAGLEPLTQKVMSQAKALKVISRVGVGLDNVDQKAAQALGIRVCNTPGVLTDAVAELTLGLILDLLRKISLSDRRMHQGVWEKQSGALLKGKTVGIIGFGNIGRRVADLLLAFEAKVLFTDVLKIKKAGSRQAGFTEILKQADIITFHSSSKECLIGPQEIKKLKPGVLLVNTARGTLIDEKALAAAIVSGKIGGAALDVFVEEPYQGEMSRQDKIVLTPHIGSYAREARVMMERIAVENLIKHLKAS